MIGRSFAAALLAGLLLLPGAAAAYIGPGAGFTLMTSSLVLVATIVIVLGTLLVWPFRWAWRRLRDGAPPKPWIRRLVIVGFDGQDPKLTSRFMAEGKLPNLQRLAASGCYRPLQTTVPSISPVAWSSFCTGTQPAKHNIFDFLDRDPRTYLPRLSSAEIRDTDRALRIGRFRIPIGRPAIRLLRRSQPFWRLLGEKRIWSTVLRVPITFPPEEFHGAQLSAMCAPDLLGTQGTFLYYTTRTEKHRFKEGGIRIALVAKGADRFETVIQGPGNSFRDGAPPLEVPLVITLDRAAGRARVRVGDTDLELVPGTLSPWIGLKFKAVPTVEVRGVCRMLVTEMADEFSLYVTPLQIDPEKPAMPISHPSYYASYLAKKMGRPFATLGLAEDTWALNEQVTDEATFLQQAHDIDAERQDMFFTALDRLRKGCLVCVFDATDRIQHMFWRYLDPEHPAARRGLNGHGGAIEDIYKRNDALVGRVVSKLRDGDVLFVLSDHGFTSFRRGVNLNAWLLREGYLALRPGATGEGEWLGEVDWPRTRAYALGLTGLFLNIAGREALGIVAPGAEAEALKAELVAKLNGLADDQDGKTAINEIFDTAQIYHGPYLGNAPDLLVGYNAGYRVSWDCATGVVAGPVFEDNLKTWSGDHCVDPRLVPGVFFSSHTIERDDPSLLDIAPTALRLFGLEPPPWMEGKALFESASQVTAARS